MRRVAVQEELWFSIHLRRYNPTLIYHLKQILPHAYDWRTQRWHFRLTRLNDVAQELARHGYHLSDRRVFELGRVAP